MRYRLQQIIDGIYRIAVESILWKSRRENNQCFFWNFCGKLQARQSRHFDVKENKIGVVACQVFQCLVGAVEYFAYLDASNGLQVEQETPACQRLIINYDAFHNGMVKVTL
ncbi:hypothetical protein D3C86_1651700 [compost metagenome]